MARDIRSDRGTAAQSGAGDLAALGATPAAFAVPLAVAAPDWHIGAATDDGGGGAAAGAPVLANDGHESDAALFVAAVSSPTAATVFTPAALATTAPAPAAGTTVETAAPAAPVGSGGVAIYVPAGPGIATPIVNAPPMTGEATSPAAAPAAAAELAVLPVLASDPATLEGVRASVVALEEALGALNDWLPEAGSTAPPAAATGILADAHATVAALGERLDLDAGAAHVADIATSASDHLAAAIQSTTTTVADVAATAAAIPLAIEAQVGALTIPVLDTVVGSASTALAGTVTAAAPVVDVVAATAETTLAAAAAPVAAITETVADQFAGADPPAGIHTLVGMVSAADAFSIEDTVSHADALAPALGALGAADLLAEAHPAESLLGIADPQHAGDVLHDLHDGLLGHG